MRKESKRRPPVLETQPDTPAGQAQSDLQAPVPEPISDQQDTRQHCAAEIPAIANEAPVNANGQAPTASLFTPGRDLTYLEDYAYHTSSVLVAIDEDLTIYDLNPAAMAKLGISLEEARASKCKDVLMCRNSNGTQLCGTSHCPFVRVVKAGEIIESTELYLGARPEFSAEYAVNIGSARVESRPGVAFVGRDLSSVKVANQVRANFVSMVSHELRTPLNSVHGFIDLLMQGHMGALSEEQRKYLGYAQEGVQQLMTIVEDILFMTRSDSGQFEVKAQKVNARVLAKQVVNGLKFQALKAAVILEKDIPTSAPMLYADPQRMQQVLNNLVANAIKFTPPNGTVIIRVRPHPQQKHMALFSVIDTGDGIPPEDQPHVFERFYQSNHSTQSRMGGYGLGLSIARLIVEQHGGEIYFESEPQKGTTFYFTAPLYHGQDEE